MIVILFDLMHSIDFNVNKFGFNFRRSIIYFDLSFKKSKPFEKEDKNSPKFLLLSNENIVCAKIYGILLQFLQRK